MDQEKRGPAVEPTAAPPEVLSINQVVSYNLMRARRARGWTQHDLAEALESRTGRPWSNASVSAAERAWQGGRPRKFDASELVAFAEIFTEPVAFFLLPPEDRPDLYVSLQENFSGPIAIPPNGANPALVNVRKLLISLGISYAPNFVDRMRLLVRKHLAGSWDPPLWGFSLREITSLEDLGDQWDADDPNIHIGEPVFSSDGLRTRSTLEQMKDRARREVAEELIRGDSPDGSRGPGDILRRAADLIEYFEWERRRGDANNDKKAEFPDDSDEGKSV